MHFAAIQREEEKATRSLRDAAKKGQKDVCMILGKEIVQSRKAVSKIYASKAQLNSVEMSMKNQLGESFVVWLLTRFFFNKVFFVEIPGGGCEKEDSLPILGL